MGTGDGAMEFHPLTTFPLYLKIPMCKRGVFSSSAPCASASTAYIGLEMAQGYCDRDTAIATDTGGSEGKEDARVIGLRIWIGVR